MDEREDRHYYKEWLQLSLIDRECKKIGLHISGGLDSALMTFLTAKFIYDNNLSAKIVPIHGWDVKRKHSYSPNTVKNILNVLRPMFSTVQIDDVHLYAYDKLSGEKKVNIQHLYCDFYIEKKLLMNLLMALLENHQSKI